MKLNSGLRLHLYYICTDIYADWSGLSLNVSYLPAIYDFRFYYSASLVNA